MTNIQIHNANYLIRKRADDLKISSLSVYERLNDNFKTTNDDNSEALTIGSFRGYWKRMLKDVSDVKKNKDKLDIRITKRTLLALDMMRVLDISIDDYLNEVFEKNFESEIEEMDSRTGFDDILDSIEEIKDKMNIGKEKYPLKERIAVIQQILVRLKFFLSQPTDDDVTNLFKGTQKVISVSEIKKYISISEFGQKTLKKLTNHATKDIDTCLNIYLLQSLIIFSIDILEKYSKMVNKKMWKSFKEWPFADCIAINYMKGENEINTINFLVEQFKDLKRYFHTLTEKFLLDTDLHIEDIAQKTEKILSTEIEALLLLFVYIEPNKEPKEIFYKKNNTSSFIKILLKDDVDKKVIEYKESMIGEVKNLISNIEEVIKEKEIITLSPIQQEALSFLQKAWTNKINGKATTPIIALGMGAGKTRVACKVISDVLKKYKDMYKYILIICPANVISDWINEMTGKCQMPEPIEISGQNRKKELERGFVERNVYITSYDSIISDVEYYMQNTPFLIIYDELHTINNEGKIQEKFFELAKLNGQVEYALALTGTPCQNSTDEFYMNYIFFHEQNKYLPKIEKRIGMSLSITNDAKKEIDEKLAKNSFYFFGEGKIGFKVSKILIPLGMEPEHFAGLQDLKNVNLHDSTINQYLQSPASVKENEIVSNLGIETSIMSIKFKFVIELIKGIPETDQIMIFSYYAKPLEELNKLLDNSVIVTGEEDPKNNDVNIDKFKANDNSARILLTTIKKSGTGENFSNANHLILLGVWWNPMADLQTLYRVIRTDQKKDVNIYMPLLLEECGNSIYRINNLENEVWENMRAKIDNYNNYIEKMIRLKSENLHTLDERKKDKVKLEIKNLESGKKELPNYVLDDLIIFDSETMEKIKNDNSYIYKRVTDENAPIMSLGELLGRKRAIHEKNGRNHFDSTVICD